MGKGIEMARVNAPEHAALMDDFRDDLLIVAMKRLRKYGDSLVFSVAETDDVRLDMLAFKVVDGAFHFQLQKKE